MALPPQERGPGKLRTPERIRSSLELENPQQVAAWLLLGGGLVGEVAAITQLTPAIVAETAKQSTSVRTESLLDTSRTTNSVIEAFARRVIIAGLTGPQDEIEAVIPQSKERPGIAARVVYTAYEKASRESEDALARYTELAQPYVRDTVETMYNGLQDSLFRFVLNRTGDRGLAQDIMHEAFTRMLGSVARTPGIIANPTGKDGSAWGITIATNLIRDHYKSLGVRSETLLEGSESVFEKPADVISVEEQVIKTDTAKSVRALIGQLKEEHEEILRLRFLEGLSPAQVAERLGLELSVVKNRQHRAVKALGRKIGILQLDESVLKKPLIGEQADQDTVAEPAKQEAQRLSLRLRARTEEPGGIIVSISSYEPQLVNELQDRDLVSAALSEDTEQSNVGELGDESHNLTSRQFITKDRQAKIDYIRLLLTVQPLSRQQLSVAMGVAHSTISVIVSQLIAEGKVIEGDIVPKNQFGGRLERRLMYIVPDEEDDGVEQKSKYRRSTIKDSKKAIIREHLASSLLSGRNLSASTGLHRSTINRLVGEMLKDREITDLTGTDKGRERQLGLLRPILRVFRGDGFALAVIRDTQFTNIVTIRGDETLPVFDFLVSNNNQPLHISEIAQGVDAEVSSDSVPATMSYLKKNLGYGLGKNRLFTTSHKGGPTSLHELTAIVEHISPGDLVSGDNVYNLLNNPNERVSILWIPATDKIIQVPRAIGTILTGIPIGEENALSVLEIGKILWPDRDESEINLDAVRSYIRDAVLAIGNNGPPIKERKELVNGKWTLKRYFESPNADQKPAEKSPHDHPYAEYAHIFDLNILDRLNAEDRELLILVDGKGGTIWNIARNMDRSYLHLERAYAQAKSRYESTKKAAHEAG